MADTYQVPGQGFSFQIPSNGEVFRTDAEASGIYVNKDGKIYQLSPGNIAAARYGFTATSDGNLPGRFRGVRNGHFLAGVEILKNEYGIDFDAIPQVNYNWADVNSARNLQMAGNISPQDFVAQFKVNPPPVQSGQVFTQEVAPDNPQGVQVTNTTTGQVVTKSPSTAEVAASIGLTPEQMTVQAAQASAPTPVQIGTPTPAPTPPTASAAPAQPVVLTPQQQAAYFQSQSNSPTPLSPTDWLAQQGIVAPAQQSVSTTTPPNQPVVLTPEQQTQYFQSQSGSATPLSPAQWLALQGGTQSAAPTPTPAPSPTTQAPANTQGQGTDIQLTPEQQAIVNAGNAAGASASATTGIPYNPVNAGNVGVLPNIPTQYDQRLLDKVLSNPNLTEDQRKIIKSVFDAISTNDTASANRFLQAFNASSEFSQPFFKAQIALVTDALTRGLSANEGDLEFSQNQLRKTLADLEANTAASQGQLDLTHAQELKNLARSLKLDLETNAQNLASVGKTSSSIRTRADQLISEDNAGLVESANRGFSFQTGNLQRGLSSAQSNTAAELARLTDKATQAKIAALREAEQKIGSDALSAAGYTGADVFGGLLGDLPKQQYEQAIAAGRAAINTPTFII